MKKINLIFITIFAVFLAFSSSGQVTKTLFFENFTEPDYAVSGTDSVGIDWDTDGVQNERAGVFVQSNVLIGNVTTFNGYEVFETNSIDVDGYEDITVSFDYWSTDNMDAQDEIVIRVQFDGGSWDTIVDHQGQTPDPIPTTVSTTIASGPNSYANLIIEAIILTGFDASGDEAYMVDNLRVTGVDQGPTAVCIDTVVYLDGNGSYTLSTSEVDGGSTDSIGITGWQINPTGFNCTAIINNDNDVTLRVTDVEGQWDECTALVTVLDTLAPVIPEASMDTILFLDSSGDASLAASGVDNGTTDNCDSSPSLTLSKYSFDCDDTNGKWFAYFPGPTPPYISDASETVWLYAEDEYNNIDSVSFTVSVYDTISPAVTTKPFTAELDVSGDVTISATDVLLSSSDNCGISGMWLDEYDFDCDDQGENTVYLTVSDVNGNSTTKSAIVTVVNSNEPVITCVTNGVVYLDDDGIAEVEDNWDLIETWTATCADPDDFTLELDIDTFYCADVLGVDVVLTVTDTAGNFTTCDLIISAIDTIAPTAVCAPITVHLDETGNVSIEAEDIDNGSFDNCTIDTIYLDNYDFDCADIGGVLPLSSTKSATIIGNWVTLTIEDESDNSSTCETWVLVKDTFPPEVECKDITVQLDASGDVNFDANDVVHSIWDCTDSASIIYTLDTMNFSCANLGTTDVVLTVRDESNNTSTCSAVVTVEDNVDPMASTMSILAYLDENGEVWIAEDAIDNGSYDNDTCGVLTYDTDTTYFTCEDVGEDNWVTLEVTDASGNSSSNGGWVTVLDTVSPVALCNVTSTIYLDEFGEVTVVAADLDGGSTDACGIDTLIILEGEQLYTGADIGVLDTLTLEVTDIHGNSSTCETSVMVVDEVAPTVVCNTIDILLFDDGRYVLKDADFAALSAGSTDNVDSLGLIITALPQAFDCDDITKETWIDVTATDLSGNESTCRVLVTVNDENPLWVDAVDSVQVEVDAGVCTTVIEYPVFVSSGCVNWEQTAGLGEDGDFPIGVTVESWTGTDPYGDTVAVSFVVEITTTNAAPTVEAVADTTVLEDAAVVVVLLDGISPGVDCDSQSVVVTAMGMNASLVTDIVVDYTAPDSTGTVSLTVAPDMSGTDTVTVYVEDSVGDSTSVTFVVTVTAVNDLPTIDAIADVEVGEDTPMATVMLSGISSGASNEAQTLTVTAVGGDTTIVSTIVVDYTSADSTGALELTMTPLMIGSDTITVTVSDSVDSVSETFVLTVVEVNHAPVVVLPIDDQTVNASYELTVALGGVFEDVDGDDLTLMATLVGDSVWMPLADATYSYTPMIADTGCFMLVVKATDPDGLMAADTFEVCVLGYPTAINDFDASLFEVTMYPNPTRGMVTMNLNSSAVHDVDLSVTDMTGRMVLRQQFSGAEIISFDMSSHVSGMYFVKLGVDGKQVVKKLILEK